MVRAIETGINSFNYTENCYRVTCISVHDCEVLLESLLVSHRLSVLLCY
jgi:hypothetical protein